MRSKKESNGGKERKMNEEREKMNIKERKRIQCVAGCWLSVQAVNLMWG